MPKQPPPQELRLTGGVSLAIWMGGVASEIDRLLRAGEQKSTEQKVYAELLELAQFEPRVDVVSGTSAGGINGAILAGAVARERTLDDLRDIWLDVADFSLLLRPPYEKDQESLLKGDSYFTPGLQRGIRSVLGDGQVDGKPGPPVDLLVTTTLLNGEDSGLVDSFGTRVPDVRHGGLFKFDRRELMGGDIVKRLALAASRAPRSPSRSSPAGCRARRTRLTTTTRR